MLFFCKKYPLKLLTGPFVLILLGLLMPAGISPIHFTDPRSQKHYWLQTNLSYEQVLEYVSNVSCHQNDLQFLSCVNALRSAGLEYGFGVNFSGEWISPPKSSNQERSELLSWQLLIEQSDVNLDFERLILTLKEKTPKEEQSYLHALLINGYLSVRYDPHTYIVPVSFYENIFFSHGLQQLDELGALIRATPRGSFVRFVMAGSPAEKSGLRKGDRIIEVNLVSTLEQKQLEILGSVYLGLSSAKAQSGSDLSIKKTNHLESAREERIAVALKEARSSGRPIRLTILRQNSEEDKILQVTVQPQRQLYPLVQTQKVARQVFSIRIQRIVHGVCQKLRNEIQILRAEDLRGLILDLRDNTGGSVEEAHCILDLLTPKGLALFETHYLEGSIRRESHFSKNDPVFSGPLVILINSSTASAAEIIAGSLKDLGRAQLLGTRTFGKATFQDGEPWNNSDEIVSFRTRGVFMFPSGWTPQGVGIEPDHQVEAPEEDGFRELDLYFSALVPVREDGTRPSHRQKARTDQAWARLLKELSPLTREPSDCLSLSDLTNNIMVNDVISDSRESGRDQVLAQASLLLKGCSLSENGNARTSLHLPGVSLSSGE